VLQRRRPILTSTLILFGMLSVSGVLAWERGDLGVGVVVGNPTGISAKYWQGKYQALDFALAWGYGDYLHIHSTYLYHFYDVIPEPEWALYTGLGGRLKLKSRRGEGDWSRFAVRMAGGLEFSYPPFEAFLEIAPVFDVAPRTEIDIEGGIGARFFFRPFRR